MSQNGTHHARRKVIFGSRQFSPEARRPQDHERGEWPGRQPECREVEAGRRAVHLLAARDLAEKVVADRIGEEGAVRLEQDQDEPGQDDGEAQDKARQRPQRTQPLRRTLFQR